MKKLLMILGMSVVLVAPFQAANALVLGTWNEPVLQSSGDTVTVGINETTDGTMFSLLWNDNSPSDGLYALGIDTVFYNSSTPVSAVFSGGTDITSLWTLNYAGSTSGGGFGTFDSGKSLQGGGTYGVSGTPLYFLLAGSNVTFPLNSMGASFAVHVRYSNGCSGWVSNATQSSSSPSYSCGGGSKVPEPSSLLLLLLGMGLLGIGMLRRRKSA